MGEANKLAKKTNFSVNNNQYYRVTATVGYNSEGKQIQKVFYGESKKEAEQKKIDYLAQINKGLAIDFDKIKFGAYFDSWLWNVHKLALKPSSFERYEGIFRNYIKPSDFYNLNLTEVRSANIQIYYNYLFQEKNKSSETIHSINKLMKTFFNYCIDEDIIYKNPCKKINIPQDIDVEDNKVEIFTTEEIDKITNEIFDKNTHHIFLVALATGLRQGELISLNVNDIDFNKKVIQVLKTAKKVSVFNKDREKSRELLIYKPKSKNSVREVPYLAQIEGLLKRIIYLEKEKHLRLGVPYRGIFVTNSTCNYYDASNLRASWARLLKRLNIPFRKYHALRHTFCSIMYYNEVPLLTAAEIMGHSFDMTAKIYTHIETSQKVQAIKDIKILNM